MREHLLLTFRHRAGVRPYTSSCDLAKPCVFVKQSPGPFHCGPPKGASFLPKLQDQFAEFLSHESLEHLRILIPATCVGLRYGPSFAFLGGLLAGLSTCPKARGTVAEASTYIRLYAPTQRPRRMMNDRYGNINPFAIGYACRLRLRTRLTLF